MIEQLLLAFPMGITVIGAFVLMMLSHSKNITLQNMNLIALFFLMSSFIMSYFTLGNHSTPFLFETVF